MDELKEKKKIVGKEKKLDNESYLSYLRDKLREAEKSDSVEKFNIMSDVSKIKITSAKLFKLSPINILFYLNYTSDVIKFSEKDKEVLFKKLFEIDLSIKRNRQELADFINWACGSMFNDKDMAKLVKKLCDASSLNDSSTLFELNSVLLTTSQNLCKKTLRKGIKNLKNKTNNTNNEINL